MQKALGSNPSRSIFRTYTNRTNIVPAEAYTNRTNIVPTDCSQRSFGFSERSLRAVGASLFVGESHQEQSERWISSLFAFSSERATKSSRSDGSPHSSLFRRREPPRAVGAMDFSHCSSLFRRREQSRANIVPRFFVGASTLFLAFSSERLELYATTRSFLRNTALNRRRCLFNTTFFFIVNSELSVVDQHGVFLHCE